MSEADDFLRKLVPEFLELIFINKALFEGFFEHKKPIVKKHRRSFFGMNCLDKLRILILEVKCTSDCLLKVLLHFSEHEVSMSLK